MVPPVKTLTFSITFSVLAVKPKEAQESIAELKAVINKGLDHKYLKYGDRR